MSLLPSSFLERSVANLQRTTMYQLLRKESKKPPLQIAQDNWPRVTFGLLAITSMHDWRTTIFNTVSPYIKKTIAILSDSIHPDDDIYPYIRPITVLAILFAGGAAITFFERFSNLVLAFRPSDCNDGQTTSPVHHSTQKDSAVVETCQPSSSSWFSWLPSTLRHAEWMYKCSLASIISLTTYVFVVRCRNHLPSLWPWIWNNPYWIGFIDGIFTSLEEDRAHLTLVQSLYEVGRTVLLIPILSRCALHVFVMDLKGEPRTWWGGKKNPEDWTTLDKMVHAVERNTRTLAVKVAKGWRIAGPWLARNWPKLALFGLSIRWCILCEDMWKETAQWILDVSAFHIRFTDPRDRQAIVYPSFGILAAVGLTTLWVSTEVFSDLILSVRVPFRNETPSNKKENETPLTDLTDASRNAGLIRHARFMFLYTVTYNSFVFVWSELNLFGRLLSWLKSTSQSPFTRALLESSLNDREKHKQALALALSGVSWRKYIQYHASGQYGMALMTAWTLRTLLKDLRGEPRTWWGGDL